MLRTIILFTLICACSLHAQVDSVDVDSVLLKHIQQQMSEQQDAAPATSASGSVISTNPDISVIGDFQLSYISPSERHFQAAMNETEIAFQSSVDPYARADFFLSIARDPETGRFGLELEEGFLTSLALPFGLQVKAGKFLGTFGKINTIHSHALPFVEAPLMYRIYLGDEGLNDEGVSMSWLVPNPLDIFQELTFEVTQGPGESPSFASSATDRFLYLAHLKNFWDLTENATFELGFTGVTGPNDAGYSTTVGAVDLTYKWKPLQYSAYHSLVLQGEALLSTKRISSGERMTTSGAYVLATYQLAQRYFLTGRFDWSNTPDDDAVIERAYSVTLGWYATEFQKIELEARRETSNGVLRHNQLLLRSIFTIGAHGAHPY